MGLLDILFPISCLGCGNEGKYLCNPCLSKVGNAKLFCLECHKSSIDGAPQADLKGKERSTNLLGAFGLNEGNSQLITNNLPLVLFDDVLTTGSTLKEACKVLKRNGAKVVW